MREKNLPDEHLPVLIVAHGQPSDPVPAGQDLARLAVAVEGACHGQGRARAVGSATLAEEGALAAALEGLGPRGVVFPMFMAGGWFTRIALTSKLQALGAAGWTVLEPFGCDGQLHALASDIVAQAFAGQDLARGEVLIAAHGSFKSSAPSDVAIALARRIKADLGLARVDVAFIDQTPRLAEVSGFGAQALCLPFFAAKGGHVTEDLPRALGTAGFGGQVLPPIGLHPAVPEVIAKAVARAQPVCAETCRHSAASSR